MTEYPPYSVTIPGAAEPNVLTPTGPPPGTTACAHGGRCLRKHLCESAQSVTGPSVPVEGRPARGQIERRKPALSQDA